MLLRRLLLSTADSRNDPCLFYISECPGGDVCNLSVAALSCIRPCRGYGGPANQVLPRSYSVFPLAYNCL